MEHNRRKSIFDTMSAIKKIRKEDEEKKHKEEELEEEIKDEEFQEYYKNWKKNLLGLQLVEMKMLAMERYKKEIKEQDHSKSENKNNLIIY